MDTTDDYTENFLGSVFEQSVIKILITDTVVTLPQRNHEIVYDIFHHKLCSASEFQQEGIWNTAETESQSFLSIFVSACACVAVDMDGSSWSLVAIQAALHQQ